MLNEVELEALATDIREHGLRVPVTLFNGQVLDGRNRLKACEVAGVEPDFEDFNGTEDDALAFVLSLNVARRHLTTPQRAVLALKLLPLEEERARQRQGTRSDLHQDPDGSDAGQALDRAGARVGVSRDAVWKTRRLAEHAPDVIAAMTEGLVKSLPEAERLAHVPAVLRSAVTAHLRGNGGRVADAVRTVRAEEQTQRLECKPDPVRVEMPGVKLLYGQHVIDTLRSLADESVQMVATSPPYWSGLRDYGAPPVVWGRVSDNCEHQWGDEGPPHHAGQVEQTKHPTATAAGAGQNGGTGSFCNSCGAWRGHLGHEPTVGLFVEHLVTVFDEIRRVLRADGTAWLVIGDNYVVPGNAHGSLKPKDLTMVPHRVAIALQDAGWWVRQDIVYQKVNALPEPVKSRPTRSHEYVFMLAKSADYYYDADAIREPFTDPRPKLDKRGRERNVGGRQDGHTRPYGIDPRPHAGRNRRSVWALPTQPLKAAHFAAFPEALVEPMILAGTSAAGACRNCGTPWAREVEHRDDADGSKPHTATYGEAARTGRSGRQLGVEAKGSAGSGFAVREATTTGWRPSCECGTDDVVPCVVLDPFSGSGTTGKVARDHGRSYIGLDLHVGYLSLAKERLGIEGGGVGSVLEGGE